MTQYNPWNLSNLLPPAEEVVAHEREIGMPARALYSYIARNYSFAVPNAQLLARIAAFSPLIDIGAGNGYWARRLEQLGADVVAVEPMVCANPVFPTIKANHTEIKHHADRAMLMVWPSRQEEWAAEAVQLYGGKTILYIGDETYDQTASLSFKDALVAAGFKLTETVPVNSWPHFFVDVLQVWGR